MMPTQSRPHSAVFSLLFLFLHLLLVSFVPELPPTWRQPLSLCWAPSPTRGLGWLDWAGLGWAGRAVWWQRRQMMSCAGHWLRLLLVTIYTATPPPSIHVISGNICTVQSVISISRCLQSSSCLTTWFYRLLFSCPKWTNGSVFVNTISLGVHGESFPFAISVKYFLCFSCCQISIPLD